MTSAEKEGEKRKKGLILRLPSDWPSVDHLRYCLSRLKGLANLDLYPSEGLFVPEGLRQSQHQRSYLHLRPLHSLPVEEEVHFPYWPSGIYRRPFFFLEKGVGS